MKLPAVWGRLVRSTAVRPEQQPLLDSEQIAGLLARSAKLDVLAGAPASTFVAGDRETRRPGSGMELDDNRPYEPGDDARHINWRLTARAGSAYVKVFREERRPCAFTLLDRRAAMRFATTGHLKVQHAAAAAISFAASASQRGAPVGALVLDPVECWLPPRHGAMGLRHLIRTAAAPAPPLDAGTQPTMADALNQLAARLRPGCDLLLLSDFIDLTESSVATLMRLQKAHRIRVLQILDPAEITLPDAGVLEISAASGGAPIAVDSHRADLRRRFEEQVRQQLQAQTRWFSNAGIAVRMLSTADTFQPATLMDVR